MKKIPTLFERDWKGDRSRVIDAVNQECAWVFFGEGIATRKIDGACCMVRGGQFFKRRELRMLDAMPDGFERADYDPLTERVYGWVPVGDGPEDQWFREAFTGADRWPDGTYELIGPKVQGNPERSRFHLMIRHGGKHGPSGPIEPQPPRDFAGLRAWMTDRDIEGIVWHHPDGRMAKLKLRDFGLRRQATSKPAFSVEDDGPGRNK
jgi:hypothetical protein